MCITFSLPTQLFRAISVFRPIFSPIGIVNEDGGYFSWGGGLTVGKIILDELKFLQYVWDGQKL